MPRSRLKLLRLVLGCSVLAGLTAAFLDLRGALPAPLVHWLAAVQFVPALVGATAGLAASVIVLLAILALTLFAGRVYCSTVCPLGLLQDAIARVAGWLRPRRRPLRHTRGSRVVRYGLLAATVLTIALGQAGIGYTHADPYSNFGRIVSALFRPIVALVNNALVRPAQAAGITSVTQVTITWPTTGILFAATFVLVLVTVLAAWRRRLFCNTLCPVGTCLGLIGRFAAFRPVIARSECGKCAECLRDCKAQCIDLRTGAIDAARCVGCFNCLNACDQGAVRYRWSWTKTSGEAAPGDTTVAARMTVAAADQRQPHRAPGTHRPVVAPDAEPMRRTRGCEPAEGRQPNISPDFGRRAFIAGLGTTLAAVAGTAGVVGIARAAGDDPVGRPAPRGGAPRPPRAICPPGAGSIARFLDRCTGCNLCVSACPTHVIRPAFLEYGFEGMLKPRLDYTVAFCNFDCHRCTDVCPDGALLPLDAEAKHATRIGEAHLDIELCIVKTKGTDCAACSEHCPTKALDTKPYGDNLRLPFLQAESCIGCGACEYACPAAPKKAVTVTGEWRHGVARPVKASDVTPPPQSGGDFPF